MSQCQSISHRISVKRIILGLALRAKLGTPDVTSLRLAVIAARKTFAAEEPLRAALQDFEMRFDQVRRDPAALQTEGEKLFEAVRRASWPSITTRADIEG